MAITSLASRSTDSVASEETHDHLATSTNPPTYAVSQALQYAFRAASSPEVYRPLVDSDGSDDDDDDDELPPSYGAEAPPYFPKTPITPFVHFLLRRTGWESGDLSPFLRDGVDTWARDYATLTSELQSWELPQDPNAPLRSQTRDPCNWTGLSERDICWVDSAFPEELRNTALSLRSSVQISFVCDAEFSLKLVDAITVTLGLGVYRKRAPYRPIRYHIPSSTLGRMGSYDASWMLAALGPYLASVLGDVLLPQLQYTQLVKALFIIQCRRKFVLDARKLIEERQSSFISRWKRERRLQVLKSGQAGNGETVLAQLFAGWRVWA